MHEVLAKRKFDEDVVSLNDVLLRISRIIVNSRCYPLLDLTFDHRIPLRLLLHAPNWDEMPPSVALLDSDGSCCSTQMPGGIFNASAHPNTGQPFVCMRGTLEYHTHVSHLNEVWDQYRGTDGMDLVGIAMQIGNAWRRTLP